MSKVLLVEDNQSVLEGIVFELEMRDYEVVAAMNGRQALLYLESAAVLPDVIVSDIAMPEMDGHQLLEAVQQHTQWTGIPFIFLTAYGASEDVRLGKQLGVDDYLIKPFRPADLVVAIENKIKRTAQITASAERRLDEVRNELITLVTHELRTPMASIYGGTELLVEMLADLPDTQAQSALEIVRIGATRMNRLMQQILLILEIDSGFLSQQVEKHARPIDLVDVVNQASSQALQQQPGRASTLRIHAPEAPIYVWGLRDLLVNSVEEVLQNALRFSPADSELDVVIKAGNTVAEIIIHDRGIGIRMEDLPLIGQRFKQSNRAVREQQGAGLGLSIVRDITWLHGGAFTIESQHQVGTKVTLRFPRLREE